MKKLSVIIPTYNNGSRLVAAIESVIQFPGPELEIIIVDDGSDVPVTESLKIDDDRVHVYRQKNKGVSKARNVGLDHATGDYVLFMDADDTLVSDWWQLMTTMNGADMVLFNYFTNRGEVQNITKAESLSGEDLKSYTLRMIANPTKHLTVWGKFLKRSVLEANAIRFNEELSFAEDGDFMLRFLMKATSAKLVPRSVYRYQPNSQSVMSRPDVKKIKAYLNALSVSKAHLPLSTDTTLRCAYNYYVAMHFNVMMVHQVFLGSDWKKLRQRVRVMRLLEQEPIIQEALQGISFHSHLKPRLVPILLLKAHLNYLAGTVYQLRAKQNENVLVK